MKTFRKFIGEMAARVLDGLSRQRTQHAKAFSSLGKGINQCPTL